MKLLIALLLLSLGAKSQTKHDTIPCFLLVSDTARQSYDRSYNIDKNGKPVDTVRIYFYPTRLWQIKGYQVGNPFINYDCVNCAQYLDENKKPLLKSWAVWMKL